MPKDSLWMYIYTAAGIVAFVIIVIIISVASMQGCKGEMLCFFIHFEGNSLSKIKWHQAFE